MSALDDFDPDEEKIRDWERNHGDEPMPLKGNPLREQLLPGLFGLIDGMDEEQYVDTKAKFLLDDLVPLVDGLLKAQAQAVLSAVETEVIGRVPADITKYRGVMAGCVAEKKDSLERLNQLKEKYL